MSPWDQQDFLQILATVHQGRMAVHPVWIADVGNVRLTRQQGEHILPTEDPVMPLTLLPNHENSSPIYRKAWKYIGQIWTQRGTAGKFCYDYGNYDIGKSRCQIVKHSRPKVTTRVLNAGRVSRLEKGISLLNLQKCLAEISWQSFAFKRAMGVKQKYTENDLFQPTVSGLL